MPMWCFRSHRAPLAVLVGVGLAVSGCGRAAPARPVAQLVVAGQGPSVPPSRLGGALCRLKRRVRVKNTPWTPVFCERLATALEDAGGRHGLDPALLVAVMIQESDLDERAVRVDRTPRGLAKDSGLFGIRCLVNRAGLCQNGLVRGMAFAEVMDPITNVELGARYLAHYRDGAGRRLITVRRRLPDGSQAEQIRKVRCRHRGHAYWAHYNHGTHYISQGPARLYPLGVAALYRALRDSLELGALGPWRMAGKNRCAPLGARHRKLCEIIRASGELALAPVINAESGVPTRS